MTVRNWTEHRVFVGGKLAATFRSDTEATIFALESRKGGEKSEIWIMEVGVLELPRKRRSV